MANENLVTRAGLAGRLRGTTTADSLAKMLTRPGMADAAVRRRRLPAPQPEPAPPAPAPPPPAPSAAPQSVGLPTPSEGNPFGALPYPSAGDRIKAEDFRTLSQSLQAIYDAAVLTAALFGRAFGEVKLALATHRYDIVRVLSVFGAELNGAADGSLDGRQVLQVMPVAPGERQVLVIVTEAVDTRRYVPNLVGLTYREAMEQMRMTVGDAAASAGPMTAPHLVGLSLATAQRAGAI